MVSSVFFVNKKIGALGASGVLLLAGWQAARGAGDPKNQPQYQPIQADAATFEKEVRPALKQFCDGCHGEKKQAGGISLAGFEAALDIRRDPALWRKVLVQLRERSMPPEGKPQPAPALRDKMEAWLKATLDELDEKTPPHDPGRKVIHRLNRLEYNNTVRDLLGVTSNPADKFPADGGGGGGFDNTADTLFVPPILMERYLEAAGEVLDSAPPERIFGAQPLKKKDAATARAIIERLTPRAFRRPLEKGESERFVRVYENAVKRGLQWEDAVKLSLKAVLVSPQFLFRVEREQPGVAPYRVSDYELASRLSYFLWASMPDGELLALAAKKQLGQPKILEAQVRRMVASPKFDAFAQSFTGQWLHVRELYGVTQPDPRKFPSFTPALRDAMFAEVTNVFGSVLRDNGDLLSLLEANYTYVNEELAKHYGIEGVTGSELRRVALQNGRRGGLLTTAAVLTVTSYPQRTSPVLRGKWVLEEILGTPPPPPPPNAGALPANDTVKDGLTFRQRLEEHRKKPECSGCHARMDPIGFGLENYDPIGRWREEIGGGPVDAAGVLATGEKFSGPIELKAHLQKRKGDFLRNLTEKTLSYALGRGLEPYDVPTVRRIQKAVEADNNRAQTLLVEIAKSFPFQYRKN